MAKYVSKIQAINPKEELSYITNDKENIYIEVVGVEQDKYMELSHVSGSPVYTWRDYKNPEEDICSQNPCNKKDFEQSHDISKFNNSSNSTVNHEGEQTESSVERIRTPDHSAKCRIRFWLLVVSLCLVLVSCCIALFYSDVFAIKKETSGILSDCRKTSSNELFQPLIRYTDSEIEKQKTRKDVLRNITYNLEDIQKNVKYWKYSRCVKNPSTSENTTVFEISYFIHGTIFFFNGSNLHRSVIYAHVPLINMDCNFDVSQSSETVSFRQISANFTYFKRIPQAFYRKHNITITLPPFTRYVQYITVPGVTLIFPYAAVMQRYNGRVFQETYQVGKVIVEMQLESETIHKYELDSDYENCQH